MSQRIRTRDADAGRSPIGSPTPASAPQFSDAEQKLQTQFAKLEKQLQLLKEQTRQAQKLASMGTAAAVLAHEFNNLMTPVISFARFAIDTDDKARMIKALELTLKHAEVVTAMSDRILGLASNEAMSFQPVQLLHVFEDAVGCLCRDLSKDGITLTTEIEPSIQVMAEPKQLLQVFFNLLINARQAIDHHNGRITVSAERIDEESVAIRIKDNGGGIAPSDLDHIFDEFFSTKKDRPSKSGVGLGLSLCKEIIEEHRGAIVAESKAGEGATFTITLPSTH